jgi:hypothetical protein
MLRRERNQIIIAAYRAGKTLKQIAAEVGVDESWVSQVARMNGCKPRHAQALRGKKLHDRVTGYSKG